MSVAYRRHVWGDLLFNSAKDTPHTPGQVKRYKGCPEATSAMKKLLSVPKNKSKEYETN